MAKEPQRCGTEPDDAHETYLDRRGTPGLGLVVLDIDWPGLLSCDELDSLTAGLKRIRLGLESGYTV